MVRSGGGEERGYTTRAQADRIGELAGLGPGVRVLDIGTGAGWPGLYLAAKTGCEVVLSDVAHAGLVEAAHRARSRRITGHVGAMISSGSAPGARSASIDVVLHGDVLCCLEDKEAMLEETHRVLRSGGLTVYTAIHTAPGLDRAIHRRAVTVGPPFCDAVASYDVLTERAGFVDVEVHDVTAEYLAVARRKLEATERLAPQLSQWSGQAEVAERIRRRSDAVEAIEAGLLRRSMVLGRRQAVPPSTAAGCSALLSRSSPR